jgi:hypothetical protein
VSPSNAVLSRIVADLRADGANVSRSVPVFPRTRLPLALSSLDAVLGGGLPCGAITEIYGGVSAGRTTLASVLISAAIEAGEYAAWVDLPNAFDPGSLDSTGIDLERMLWVCPSNRITAVRAAEHVLDAGGFRVVVLDLDGQSPSRSLPPSVWLRMTRAAARRDAAVVVIGAIHTVGAFAALSLEVRACRRIFVGERGPSPVFEGATSALQVRRYRFGSAEDVVVELWASTGT